MSPRLPRDVSGSDLAKRLETFGYAVTRQKGSHLRIKQHLFCKSRFSEVGHLASLFR